MCLAKLRGEDEADDLFNWLKEMPFIEERTDGWAYHEVVKTQCSATSVFPPRKVG
jgi:hypothetical protein